MARKTGLGKGLGALIKDSETPEKQDVALEVAISCISPNPNQPRKQFVEQEIEDLKRSIAQHGVLQPILLRPHGNNYQIVAGERRYRAAKEAGLSTIPAYVKEVADEDVLALALVENLQRSNLDALEEAEAYEALLKQYGYNQTELAKVLAKSRSTIANSLRVLDLPQEVKKLIREGKLSAGHARAILQAKGKGAQVELAQIIVQDGLSVRDAERLAEAHRSLRAPVRASKAKTKAVQTKALKELSKEVSARLKHTVRIKEKSGGIQLEIQVKDAKELEVLLKHILKGKKHA